jgi:hypothetical protein
MYRLIIVLLLGYGILLLIGLWRAAMDLLTPRFPLLPPDAE